MGSPKKLKVLFFSGARGDTQRYRCHHAAAQLRLLGHEAVVLWQSDPKVLEAARWADLLILHRPARTHYLTTLLETAGDRPRVYETDDLIFDPDLLDQVPIVRQAEPRLAQEMRTYVLASAPVPDLCHAALTSTQPLAEALEARGLRAWIHRNGLSPRWLDLCRQARAEIGDGGDPTLGFFSGSPSHDDDFALLAPVLARLMERHRRLRLLLGGYVTVPPVLQPYEDRIERFPFVDWEDLPRAMARAHVHLAPLDLTNPFARARSELKYLEAAALARPTVASPNPAFRHAIRPGETGFLAATEAEWEEALEALLGDPALRRRLGEAAEAHVREAYTFEALAPQLEETLQEILDYVAERKAARKVEAPILHLDEARRRWAADRRLEEEGIRVYMATGSDVGNAGTYRCRHRQQQLALHGVPSLVRSQFGDGFYLNEAIPYEIGILHRVAHDPEVETYIRLMRQMGRPVLFDTDDLVFRPELIPYVRAIQDWPEDQKALYREGVERYRKTLLACDAVLVSTRFLARQVRELGKEAYVIRNALSWEQILHAEPHARRRLDAPLPSPQEEVRIGYFSGTATHDRDFQEAAPALLTLLKEFPNLRLRIVGPLRLDPAFEPFRDRIERRDLVPLTRLSEEIAQVDVALAPLEPDNPYCRAKSEVKYVEAGLVGVPVVATPTEAFRFAIRDGENGFLAATTEDWIRALRALIERPELRRRVGARAREDVLRRYAPEARSRELVEVLAEFWERTRPVREAANFHETFLKALWYYHELAHAYRGLQGRLRQLEPLEGKVQRLEAQVAALQAHLDAVARGRVMRILNALERGRRRLLGRR